MGIIVKRNEEGIKDNDECGMRNEVSLRSAGFMITYFFTTKLLKDLKGETR